MTQQRSILLVYSLLGAYAVCAQATLLRETQVILFGSELSWGLVLAFWLGGVAVGARTSGRLLTSPRRSLTVFAASNLAMPLFLAAQIVLLRGARSILGCGPGEYVGPWHMLLVAAATTIPVSVWIGLAFPAASGLLGELRGETQDKGRSVGRVYVAEAAGSLVGGALFSFVFVTWMDAFSLVFAGGAVLAAATWNLLRREVQSNKAPAFVLAWAAATGTVALGGWASDLDEVSVRLRWRSFAPGLEMVANHDSRYQNIAIGRLNDQFSLYTNGTVVATWPNHSALAIEAHLAACQHPAPRAMLVLGGGTEGILKELLRHRPGRLDFVTLDASVQELMVPHLSEADLAAIRNPRAFSHVVDPRRFVKQTTKTGARRYDLVLLAAPEPGSALPARLYTEEFFAELFDVMTEDGVLALSLTGSVGAWSRAVAHYVGSVKTPLERVFPEVLLTFSDPVRIYAAKRSGVVTGDGEVLATRYRARNVGSPFFDPLWFEGASDLLDAEKRQVVQRALLAQPPSRFNSDSRPVAALYRLRLWHATSGAAHRGESAPSDRTTGLVSWILDAGLARVISALILCTVAGLVAGLARGRGGLRRTALLWSVATTGFAVMALAIVLLFTFQVLYGYVYGQAGFVIGIFMFGLVVGGFSMNRRLGARPIDTPATRNSIPPAAPLGLRTVMALDVALAGFAITLAVVLSVLHGSSGDFHVQATVYVLVAATGLLGGLLFPLAASIRLREQAGTARAAGAVDAADHVGGSLGALVTGVVLVPVLGITGTCVAVAAMKALSSLLVAGGLKQVP